jgi:hypothetical protein
MHTKDSLERWRIVLSDGEYFVQSMLGAGMISTAASLANPRSEQATDCRWDSEEKLHRQAQGMELEQS